MRHPSESELRDLVVRQSSSLYPISDAEVASIEAVIPGRSQLAKSPSLGLEMNTIPGLWRGSIRPVAQLSVGGLSLSAHARV